MWYMEIFFSGRDLDRLYSIVADDLRFTGPLYHFASAREYVESLKADPPVDCHYELRHTFEHGPWVNLIYEFFKPTVRADMSQLFEVRDEKIIRILLIFDTGRFQ